MLCVGLASMDRETLARIGGRIGGTSRGDRTNKRFCPIVGRSVNPSSRLSGPVRPKGSALMLGHAAASTMASRLVETSSAQRPFRVECSRCTCRSSDILRSSQQRSPSWRARLGLPVQLEGGRTSSASRSARPSVPSPARARAPATQVRTRRFLHDAGLLRGVCRARDEHTLNRVPSVLIRS